jgi:hypothetical protein
MRYDSVTCITASTESSSGSTRATSPSSFEGEESVIGMGQKTPAAVRISSHTPFQSAWVMKPASGVKPPMPSITRSPFSRDVTRRRGKDSARLRSAAMFGSSISSGRRPAPPWGGTSGMELMAR